MVPFQFFEDEKMEVIAFNSRIFIPQEQKLSTLDREFLCIVPALQIYNFFFIGSPHPIHISKSTTSFTLFHKESNPSPRFFCAQMQLTKVFKLEMIQTPGKHFSFANMLSQSFTKN